MTNTGRTTAGLEQKINEIADRIKGLRLDLGLSTAEIAEKVGVSEAQYIRYEEGVDDFSFTFVYKIAMLAGVEINDLLEGSSASLTEYEVTRKGEGLPIARRAGFEYLRLCNNFKNKLCEPFRVIIPYSEEALNPPYELVSHEGQELNIVVRGTLKVQVGEHSEVLHPGDSIIFNSNQPHNEYALGGEDCEFFAIILNPEYGTGKEVPFTTEVVTNAKTNTDLANLKDPVYKKYVVDELDENGMVKNVEFTRECERFNFAFDLVDKIAEKNPDKTAMIWVAKDGVSDHRYTFEEMKKFSAKTANYFESLGIKKGDKVMLVLKRHYQFWFSILALHKIGAIAIPATNLLKAHDFEYRFKAAGVDAIVCTGDGDVAEEAKKAMADCGMDLLSIMVNDCRDGWHDFNKEYESFSDVYERKADTPCGNDPMVMFFSSGTTGYPKIVSHSYKYALGHYVTAKFWHNVDPNGLHFTISDTGWGKALWGKLYGQWLCEAPTFTFDFDKFKASEILPMFAKYNITTFCAPPTMYRFLVKEDLSHYDLSSLKYATVAGEALNPEVFNQFMKATGIRLMEGFGQTETTLAIGNLVGSSIRLGSMGKANPYYDIHILDEEGNECKPGVTGEICVKTSHKIPCGLYLGYYRNEEKTKEAWHDDFYHTGDTAWKDEEGYFWYVGRVDDVIKCSGYRIGPFEIESVIMELPYVLECAVTATPDPEGIRGNVVKATIVLVPGKATPSDELKKEVQQYVKKNTAPYKYPRVVEFVEELPKTISGKIKRSVIRQS